MFRANSGSRIAITPTGTDCTRVWLEVPVGNAQDEHARGYNVISVSVEAADLERAIKQWELERNMPVASHA